MVLLTNIHVDQTDYLMRGVVHEAKPKRRGLFTASEGLASEEDVCDAPK